MTHTVELTRTQRLMLKQEHREPLTELEVKEKFASLGAPAQKQRDRNALKGSTLIPGQLMTAPPVIRLMADVLFHTTDIRFRDMDMAIAVSADYWQEWVRQTPEERAERTTRMKGAVVLQHMKTVEELSYEHDDGLSLPIVGQLSSALTYAVARAIEDVNAAEILTANGTG